MAQQRNALKAGIFIVLTIAAIVAVIIGIRGLENFTQPTQMRTVSFALVDDVGGLRIGDEVRAGGFKIGEVKNIEIKEASPGAAPANAAASNPSSAPANEPSIIITYAIPRHYVIHDGARLRIQGTLTGTSWLNFESFGGGAVQPPSVALAGLPSAMNELLASVGKSGPDLQNTLSDIQRKTLPALQNALSDIQTKTIPAVNDMIARYSHAGDAFAATGDSARQLVAKLNDQVDPMVQKYNQTMDVVRDKGGIMLDKVAAFFGDTTPDFRKTLASLAKISGDIEGRLPGMMDHLNDALTRLDEGIQKASTAMEDIKATAANLKDLTATGRELIVGNRGKLNEMIADLKTTGENLKGATAEIRRSPWRLLYKPAPNEMANLNLFDAARAFSDGAGELNDASLALRDAVQSKQLSKEDLQKLMDRVNQSFAKFQAVEQKLFQDVKQ